MKKFFEICGTLLAVAMLGYFLWSWHDIVKDNSEPNPTHSPYNLFTLINPEEEDACGHQPVKSSRIECGRIVTIDNATNTIVFLDDTGNEWIIEVNCVNDFDINSDYCICFNTVGTENVEDDIVTKVFVEKMFVEEA